MKMFWNLILLIFAHRGEWAEDAVKNGVVSYEGEGRNKYGK